MEIQKMQSQLANITTDIELIKQIYHVNYLIPYPLNDAMIEGWAKSLQELEPEITADIVKWIVDKAKIGAFEWDNKKGIQNIFKGFVFYLQDVINKQGYHIENKYNILYKKYNNIKQSNNGLL